VDILILWECEIWFVPLRINQTLYIKPIEEEHFLSLGLNY